MKLQQFLLVALLCVAACKDVKASCNKPSSDMTGLLQISAASSSGESNGPVCTEAQLSSAISEMDGDCQESISKALKSGDPGDCYCFQQVSLKTASGMTCYGTSASRDASNGSTSGFLYNEYLKCNDIDQADIHNLTRVGPYDYQYSTRKAACRAIQSTLQSQSPWDPPQTKTYSYPCSDASAKLMPLVAGTYKCTSGYMWYEGAPPSDLEGVEECPSVTSYWPTGEDACLYYFDSVAYKKTSLNSLCSLLMPTKDYTVQTYPMPNRPGEWAPGYPNTLIGGLGLKKSDNITSFECNLSPGNPPSLSYADCQ